MTNTIEAAGCILSDTEGLIHGTGATADEAWADARATFTAANIDLISDDADSTEQSGSWAREGDFRVRPATAVLIEAVRAGGGNLGWTTQNGVACTDAELEDECAE